jgi:formylglycine-generating enzyme required for sulfatase activity
MARMWSSHPLEDGCPPMWATAWGQDRHGVFVEFVVGEAMQRMRWIVPGRFMMGSPPDEEGREENEGPVHQVVISKGFWLFDTPCCQDLWEAVLGKEANQSHFHHPRKPVDTVSLNDAVAFIQKLNELIPGVLLRLPLEAEWEYACRAGTTGARYGELDEVAWYAGNSGDETHVTGVKTPNAWGLFDMLGNVWECCGDSLRNYSPRMTIDPDGGRGARCVIRGGRWGSAAPHIRAACRDWSQPGYRDGVLGFRCLSSGIEESRERVWAE